MPAGGIPWIPQDWFLQAPVRRAGPLHAHAVLERNWLLLVCRFRWQSYRGHRNAWPS